MQSNVTTVEVPKCVSAAVKLPRESGLPFVADLFEERVGITNSFLGVTTVQSSARIVPIFK